MGTRDAAICEDLLGPLRAEFRSDVCSYLLELWDHVGMDGILVARFEVEELERAGWIVARVAYLYGFLEKSGRICVDDNRSPSLEIIHFLPDIHRIVVEM